MTPVWAARIEERLRGARDGFLALTRVEQTVYVLTALVVGLGFALRVRGFLFDRPALWLDEAAWAVLLIRLPLEELLIRPPGFMGVSKVLALLFGPTETVLRTLPWVSGVAATLLAVPLSRRLFALPVARLLFVSIIALHPGAIDLAKEFKPYSVALFLHLALMYWALRYWAAPERRVLTWALVTAAVGLLFTQDLVFAFPGYFLVIGFRALRTARPHVVAVVLTALLIVGMLVLQYVLIWSQLPEDESEYWGNKYNVFFTGKDEQTALSWWLERHGNLVAFPGYRRTLWNGPDWISAEVRKELRSVDLVVWIVMHLSGLAVLALRRRGLAAMLLLLPLGAFWLFNALGFWPGGVFRTNLFTLAYTGALSALAFDALPRNTTWSIIGPTVVLVLAPLVLFDKDWNKHKDALTHDSGLPDLMKQLLRNERRLGVRPVKTPLILDRRTCSPFRYYTKIHPTRSIRFQPLFEELFVARCLQKDESLAAAIRRSVADGEGRAWVIVHDMTVVDKILKTASLREIELARQDYRRPHSLLLFAKKGAVPQPPGSASAAKPRSSGTPKTRGP